MDFAPAHIMKTLTVLEGTMGTIPRLKAFGAAGEHIGSFDGIYVYDLDGNLLYRVEDGKVFHQSLERERVGTLEGPRATAPDGRVLFILEH